MDWQSVYEDDAAAEIPGAWDAVIQAKFDSRSRNRILSTLSSGQYTPAIMYCFTVNYILGVGCLGVPYAFMQAGVVLGSLLIIVCSFATFVTVAWVAEASTLVMQLRMRERGNPFQSPKGAKPAAATTATAIAAAATAAAVQQGAQSETQGLLKAAALTASSSLRDLYSAVSLAPSVVTQTRTDGSDQPSLQQSRRPGSRWASKRNSCDLAAALASDEIIVEPEVSALCERFLGPTFAHWVYQGSLMALAYIGLLAYSQVFTQGMISFFLAESQIPAYAWPMTLAVFACIVVPLSLFDLNEQVHVQVVMSVLRFVSLGILLLGTLAAIWVDPAYSAPSNGGSTPAGPDSLLPMPWFDRGGLGLMFTTSIFSQLFQHSVPGLIRPLAYHHRQEVPGIFAAALATTASLYILTGSAAVYYFRERTSESINLNFAGYYWGVTETSVWRPVVALLSTIVVLFPALDTLSVFPLIANTLGNNLHASFPASALEPLVAACCPATPASASQQKPTREEQQARAQEQHRWVSVCFRLVAALPPILLSLVITDLTVSLQLAGIAGIVVALVTPALLQIASSASQAGEAVLSPYCVPGVTDLPGLPYAVLAMSAVAFSVCALQLVAS